MKPASPAEWLGHSSQMLVKHRFSTLTDESEQPFSS